LDGGYARRVASHFFVLPILSWLMARGAIVFMQQDPILAAQPGSLKRPSFRAWLRTSKRGLLPGPVGLLRSYLTYLSPTFHPSHEGSTSQAVAYLAKSPAVVATQQAALHN
jgi:predicted metal-dependent hydrolase